ncbi:MAG: pyridoxamine 5'-phosphate oxidase family protein [Pseudomonadales bacterium]|nr:pyridoxamine 5'-phosphate oxidase family protein [Pseudomonadales bacterium]
MNLSTKKPSTLNSPFHQGEIAIQTKLQVHEKMQAFGMKVIRDFFPPQHRVFYQTLPYLFLGYADEEGWPWASLLHGERGFINTPNDKTLKVSTKLVSGDPLQRAMSVGRGFGVLGIDLETRRRNRLTAYCERVDENGFELKVNQTFGNCPKYIQTRHQQFLPESEQRPVVVESLSSLDESAIALIKESDTFFVATYYEKTGFSEGQQASEGADVSHRGGEPGFIKIREDNTLVIPDYEGNKHFNTLGNILENAKAGLLFVDFEKGHLLSMTGRAEILWDSPDLADYPGAERLWTFKLHRAVRIENALPFRWVPSE